MSTPSQPTDERPKPPPPITPALVAREIRRSLRDALIEVAVWAAAVTVVVGGLGLLGYLVAGSGGMLAGILAGVVVLGVVWLLLVIWGISLAAKLLRRPDRR